MLVREVLPEEMYDQKEYVPTEKFMPARDAGVAGGGVLTGIHCRRAMHKTKNERKRKTILPAHAGSDGHSRNVGKPRFTHPAAADCDRPHYNQSRTEVDQTPAGLDTADDAGTLYAQRDRVID